MKIGFYDPYLDTLGGGEKYIFDLALCLSNDNSVYIFWNDASILQKAEERFGKKLNKISLVPNTFSKGASLFSKYRQTSKYDCIFYISDGSIPLLFAEKNILIFQFPIPWIRKTWLSNLKLKNINNVICYSNFVKENIDKILNVNSIVLPPLVEKISSKEKKQNLIVSVGRFTKGMNKKKQEVLVEVFKEMVDDGLKNWKLVLIGSHLAGDLDFVESLIKQSNEYPIEIHTNVKYDELRDVYAKSKIYWHGAGFGENLERSPQFAEHFGITTVEAMSAGCVPAVFNAGGQKEIVTNEKNGILWNTTVELKEKTKKLIDDEKLLNELSLNARKSSEKFSGDNFCKEARDIVL